MEWVQENMIRNANKASLFWPKIAVISKKKSTQYNYYSGVKSKGGGDQSAWSPLEMKTVLGSVSPYSSRRAEPHPSLVP